METLGKATAGVLSKVRAMNTSLISSDAHWAPTIDAYHPDIKTAAEQASFFISSMAAGLPPYWLTFSGIPGTGKTMLAKQIFEEAKKHNPGRHSLWVPPGASGVLRDEDRRPYCIWLDAARFATRMREGEYNLPESYAPDFLLVFDDLGTDRDKTDFIAEAVYRLAASRLGRWTVWTTNLTAAEVSERIDNRVASRMIRDENRFVSLRCGDYALRKKP